MVVEVFLIWWSCSECVPTRTHYCLAFQNNKIREGKTRRRRMESKHLSELGFVDVHKMPKKEVCDEDDLIRNEVELRLLCNVMYLQLSCSGELMYKN